MKSRVVAEFVLPRELAGCQVGRRGEPPAPSLFVGSKVMLSWEKAWVSVKGEMMRDLDDLLRYCRKFACEVVRIISGSSNSPLAELSINWLDFLRGKIVELNILPDL